jgi:hypothetical protein
MWRPIRDRKKQAYNNCGSLKEVVSLEARGEER